ncbi:MAG TPA: hypothetical protein VM935_05220 [Chitinophagaceae bacterium]|jgi:uncharacterized protein involved in exopolysaccharide biosynthesis|nr:hypothetical protein [Chitinophagaceae bacterium]
MEVSKFFKHLLRYKRLLILVPLITLIATGFLVRNLPDTYASTSRLSTGIVDRADQLIRGIQFMQESKITQEFSNLTEMILMKKIINQVSYRLILHDLTGSAPFRELGTPLADLTKAQKEEAIAVFTKKYELKEELILSNKKEKELQKLLKVQKYDDESIRKKLSCYRANSSDFINLRFECENPLLSAFVLNTLCNEFISYYNFNLNESKTKGIAFLDSIMNKKQADLRSKMQELKDYKVRNGVLDVNNQASTLIGQIADLEAKRQEARKNISAYQGALQNIDARFDPADRKYIESSVTTLNQEISTTRNRLAGLNDEYVKSNFDSKYKAKIDSLQNTLATQINKTNDNSANSPLSSKQTLVEQKLNMEVSLDMAKNSVSSLGTELGRLNGKLYTLVPDQAAIKALQDDIDIYSNEFIKLSDRFNQVSLDANFSSKLKQIEVATPGVLQPSRKILMVLLGGILSFVFCAVGLFIQFYMDHSIKDVQELANATQQPVIGFLNLLQGDIPNLNEIWNRSNQSDELKYFKNQLRSIRFEIDSDLNESKVVAVTSLGPTEGRTFSAINLAHAYKVINKKVLLIDGNFGGSSITDTLKPTLFLEDYLYSKKEEFLISVSEDDFLVMGNKGGDTSILEISAANVIHAKMQVLRDVFDVIIIETPSLDTFSCAREWTAFADKVVGVFEAGQTIDTSKSENINYLSSLNEKFAGWILNKVKPEKNIYVTNKKSKLEKKLAA